MNPARCKKFFLAAAAVLCAAPLFARAAGVAVTPAVIDDKGLPRDILNYTLTITNSGGRMETLFPTVNNLTAEGKQVFMVPGTEDRATSLANWIGISRGVIDLKPGEAKKIPMMITVNPYARSDTYHAVIAFGNGSTRDEAERNLAGAPQVLVDFSVISDAKEELELESFGAAHRFYASGPAAIDFAVKNIGNVPSTPAGAVRIYDRSGHEIAAIDANDQKTAIAPGETKTFSVTWQGGGFGQYKALLDVRYGAEAELQDAAFFWLLPWQKILAVFGMLLALIVVCAFFLYRRYEAWHAARLRKFSSAAARKAFPEIVAPPSVVDLRARPQQPDGRDDPKNDFEYYR